MRYPPGYVPDVAQEPVMLLDLKGAAFAAGPVTAAVQAAREAGLLRHTMFWCVEGHPRAGEATISRSPEIAPASLIFIQQYSVPPRILFIFHLVVCTEAVVPFVDLLLFLFGVLGGMCGESSCNVFLLLFMFLGVPISAMLCRRAVLMLWHAFLILGLRFFPLLFFPWWLIVLLFRLCRSETFS
jgi:hypothetical protein